MRRGWSRVRIVVVMNVLLGAALVPFPTESEAHERDVPRIWHATETFGPQTLCTQLTPAGWGFSCGSITNPGPEIAVAQGETVILDLLANDLAHTFLLDYNGSGFQEPGENESAIFSSPSTPLRFTFVATGAPGTYNYICGVHGSVQNGRFRIIPATAPTVSLTNPSGVAQDWTGGSTKTITWTMNDPDGTKANLKVWVNFSHTGGSGTIASALTGAESASWNVPLVDATDMRITVDVVDPNNEKATDSKLVPVVDSTRPAVTAVSPDNAATNVNRGTWINITFSEAMNQPATQGAVSLCSLPGCTNVPLTVVVWTGNTLTVRPTNPLAGNTQYQGTISAAARDTSDPGNFLQAPFQWTFRTANTPPTLTADQPTGGIRWTGGSVHDIAWTASDSEDAPNALRVWANYSATGTAPFTPIAGLQGVPGSSSPFAWTVPAQDTASARLEFTVLDTGGSKTTVLSDAFAIDSTPPTVVQTLPSDGATGVPLNANIDITFSEPMNKAATGTASVVGLQDVSTSAWVPATFAWDSPGLVLTVNPVPLLLPMTGYRIVVNGTARDGSDPGNTMGAAVSSTFTTGTAADTTPPTITNVAATPATQVSGGSVAISATITDDTSVSSVRVNVTRPDSTTTNQSMAAEPNDRFSFTSSWTQVGMHTFVIWATDGVGNVASASGSFEITPPEDTTPPTITHTPPAGPFETGATIVIEATVTDDDQVQVVKLVYTDVAGTDHNLTMTLQAGKYTFTIPAQGAAGTIVYRIYAEDASGNPALSPEFTLVVETPEQPPPPGLSPALLVGLLALVVVIVAVAAVLLRRRKKGGQPS